MTRKTVEVTAANFKQLLQSDMLVLVDFWAKWCGTCHLVSPMVEELAAAYEGRVIIGKLNVDANLQFAHDLGVRSIPTLLVFKNGQLVDKQVGVVDQLALARKLEAHLTA